MLRNDALYLDTEVAAGTVHLRDVGPLVRLWVEALAVVHSRDAVEASDGEQAVVMRDDANARASVAHVLNQRPLVGGRAVGFCAAQTLLTVEASSDVHFICGKNFRAEFFTQKM